MASTVNKGHTQLTIWVDIFIELYKCFIIYPSMYCSKYRPYRAVEYKPADRIFRITTVWFSVSPQCDFPYHHSVIFRITTVWFSDSVSYLSDV